MPGAGKQSTEVQDQIKHLLEAGFDPTTIHRRLKVGRSSIYRMKRCLQEHGTAYMPREMNKKNGRPKVLTAEQELEVREWLRDPKNRTRYLDDLVWLIHDRFGIVCSTTTMSKMKRKWLRVIESEESGQPLDEATRKLVTETHPDLPVLQLTGDGTGQHQPMSAQDPTQQQTMSMPNAQMVQQQAQQGIEAEEALHHAHQQQDQSSLPLQSQHALQHHQNQEPFLQQHHQHNPNIDSRLQQDPNLDSRLLSQQVQQLNPSHNLNQSHTQHNQPLPPNTDPALQDSNSSAGIEAQLHAAAAAAAAVSAAAQHQSQHQYPPPPPQTHLTIDARLEQRIQQDLRNVNSTARM
ncbi:Hypothetical protein R9X50_00206800 [Acrodontium crateriforme]|uniref:Uncharacterized protein n=1 Tax=Acrodontium crateriforme TaxID=150365 RepID=A0AAQ3M374_9PEZI|nr:Hypothetical protein R9X50_00206800 [Acrodontium crateriforme]